MWNEHIHKIPTVDMCATTGSTEIYLLTNYIT